MKQAPEQPLRKAAVQKRATTCKGFVTLAEIETAEGEGVVVYASAPASLPHAGRNLPSSGGL